MITQNKKPKRERKPKLQHIRFAEAYIRTGSAKEAAKAAGYGKKGTKRLDHVGWELLENPRVQELITVARTAAMQKLGMTAEEIIGRLSIIGRANLKHVASWGYKEIERVVKTGFGDDVTEEVVKLKEPYLIPKNSKELTEAEAFEIDSIRISRDKDGNPIIAIKRASPTAALQQLVEIRRLIGAAEGDEAKELKAALEKLDAEEREKRAAAARGNSSDGRKAKDIKPARAAPSEEESEEGEDGSGDEEAE